MKTKHLESIMTLKVHLIICIAINALIEGKPLKDI